MNKLLIFASLVLFSATGMAQKKTEKASVKWGKDMTISDDGMFESLVEEDGTSSYQLMMRKKDLQLQRMDGLVKVWQKPLELEWNKEDMKLERIALAQDRILVLASVYDKKANENLLFCRAYGKEGFSPLTAMERVGRIPAQKAANKGSFAVRTSPDGSKVLVHAYGPTEKGVPQRSEIFIFNASMESLWSQEFKLPYASEEFMVESERVDDDGSVMLVGVKYAQKAEKRELKRANKATYEYHVLVYNGNSTTPEDHVVAVADKFLQDMTISLGKSGDIVCAGLYGNKGSFSVRGAFFLRIDRTTKQIVHESFKPFTDDFITSYMTEKQAAKAKKKAEKKDEEMELPEFNLSDIIHREDGGAVLLAEQYYWYMTTHTMSTGNGGTTTVTTVHYHHNDVLVVNIDPQGNIEWATKVPKRQHTTNSDTYSGFSAAVKGDKIYLVFNDSGENLFVKPGDKVQQFELTGKDALVVLATVDGDGNVTREALFSPERRDVILRPMDCAQLKDGSMFIYASRKKDYRFGLITFD